MSADVPSHLLALGAVIEDGVVRHFGNPESELRATASGAAIMADLAHFGVIRATGDDCAAFLNGQLSCDVRSLAVNQSVAGSYCTAKGRMLANFLLWQSADGYYLMMRRELVPSIGKRLGMYVLRSKVKLEDVTAQTSLTGFAGAVAPSLSAVLGELPDGEHQAKHGNLGLLLRLPGARWLLAGDAAGAARCWSELAGQFAPVGAGCWNWLDIRAGLPWITAATQEAFVPQMANMELIGGVNFQKGCYPGQEIVARTQYLGKLKRRMYLAHIASETPPEPGMDLYSENFGDQASGMVVNAEACPTGGYDLLAVTQVAGVPDSPVHLGSLQGPVLAFEPLPYAVT